MADSIGDIELSEEWVDVHSLTGFTKISSINIQNKTSDNIFIVINANKPTFSKLRLEQGVLLQPFNIFTVPAAQSGCWIKGFGQIHIWQ